jgi:hypothetical protein
VANNVRGFIVVSSPGGGGRPPRVVLRTAPERAGSPARFAGVTEKDVIAGEVLAGDGGRLVTRSRPAALP